ncbi:SDR family NAD(P)-dependent oxidoreductase [Kribbella sp. CA-294648]|uniref:SDR family NAD(P)-dependent oxidoreductase n=1 Tax=Kribbella sp. CA-294648 TaxID=3239948 RepID=UPI003D8DB51C
MRNLIWISGASSGIGAALAVSTPYADSRVVDLSRRGGVVEHFAADLADPADWRRVEEHFVAELAGFDGDRVIFVHNAGTVVPIGPAATVDADAYAKAVLLNSAAPQVLGRAFLRATAGLDCERHLVMLSSGAATKAYPGWSAYNAGKAAVDHWVRTVGLEEAAAEQDSGGAVKACRVVAVAPGVVDTAMQSEIRSVDEQAFPAVERFRELKSSGGLITPEEAAAGLWAVIAAQYPPGTVLDLRNLPS